MKWLTRLSSSTVFRYAMAGGTASLADVVLFNFFVFIGGAHYILAVIVSSAISFFLRFFLQRKAFRPAGGKAISVELLQYSALFAVGVVLTASCMYILVEFVHIQKSIAQIISILLVAVFCFFIYRTVIFSDPSSGRARQGRARKLLIITQKVDMNDTVLGFFHEWIRGMAGMFDEVSVICLEKGRSELPENVKVLSLGKEERQSRLQYLIHFYWYILHEKKNYDTVFVHMNQQYVILGAIVWKILHKGIYMWRNHVSGGLMTKVAVRICDKVFCTSEYSYTARYKKTILMPVGVDTDLFQKRQGIEVIPRSILFLGRMAPIKKPDILSNALILLKKKGFIFTASFYGDPLPHNQKYYETFKENIEIEDLGSKVAFYPGIRNDETVNVYNSHEVFINLTPSGSYDKTIFEAMACETLVVASNKSLYGLIREDSIFKEGDAADLARTIEKILLLPEKQKAERREGQRAVVVENHSLKKLMSLLSIHITLI